MHGTRLIFFFFFFNDTATTEIYTLSLHDALPIWRLSFAHPKNVALLRRGRTQSDERSEEHTSELQSQSNLVCRLLLEKKKKDRGVDRLLCIFEAPVLHPSVGVISSVIHLH